MFKHKELLLVALNTLFFSWGGDTPDEVMWGANDLLVWVEKELKITLNIRFERNVETYEINFDEVISVINMI